MGVVSRAFRMEPGDRIRPALLPVETQAPHAALIAGASGLHVEALLAPVGERGSERRGDLRAGVELPRAHACFGAVPKRELEPPEAAHAEVPGLHGLQAGAAPHGLDEVGYRRCAVKPGVLLGELACVRERVEVAADEPIVAGSVPDWEGVRIEGVLGAPPAMAPQDLDESREPVIQVLGPTGPGDAVLARRASG